jgi:hypothetical protein
MMYVCSMSDLGKVDIDVMIISNRHILSYLYVKVLQKLILLDITWCWISLGISPVIPPGIGYLNNQLVYHLVLDINWYMTWCWISHGIEYHLIYDIPWCGIYNFVYHVVLDITWYWISPLLL